MLSIIKIQDCWTQLVAYAGSREIYGGEASDEDLTLRKMSATDFPPGK